VFSLKWLDSKAGRSLFLLLLLASVGFRYMRQKPYSAPYQTSHSADIAAVQTTAHTMDDARLISVRPNGATDDLFQYWQSDNGFQLTRLQPLNRNEWVAAFQSQLAKGQKAAPLDRRQRGWFETENKESPASKQRPHVIHLPLAVRLPTRRRRENQSASVRYGLASRFFLTARPAFATLISN
jgi:hypothetical protein